MSQYRLAFVKYKRKTVALKYVAWFDINLRLHHVGSYRVVAGVAWHIVDRYRSPRSI